MLCRVQVYIRYIALHTIICNTEMQIQDSRNTEDVILFEDLNKAEKDVYTHLRIYICTPRVCSICRKNFSLAHSVGETYSCKGRDHVDFDTETHDDLNVFTMDAKMANVLRSDGTWTASNISRQNTVDNHGKNGLVTSITINRLCAVNVWPL
jgi:hypothetical protein